MPNTIQRRARSAFKNQGGLCHYCNVPMWIGDPSEFIAKHHLNLNQAAPFQCTAEHLIARCDGGTDESSNIVGAHLICNQRRHNMKPAPSAQAMARIVKKQLASGCWHRRSALAKVEVYSPVIFDNNGVG